MRGLHDGKIRFTLMDAKLKRQHTDVKSGSGISVGPSLKSQSQLKQNSRDTVPLINMRLRPTHLIVM